ncbi:MAG TPA: LysR family transcriptional regulator [Burkholderiaceae bacterium]|uniref:LysR family transcriptional regulator n=1 Tax=Pusillimonas sp. (ex Stolz et al. 2005) TaxID=1979962 RepID=UPI002608FE16|nr:LysR family transcriptional regulator [Pusillimonas sp. (ex Stolz et al. 2005)]HLT99076.1 LysR family transcriptional regulator [Burkholderiaceae bacterium]
MELLNDMALFVEVVQAGGFRRASETVGLTISTVSRRITRLEKTIGLRLLHRTTRKIELTEAGRIYFERCKHLVDEARLAHEQLGQLQVQPTGTLKASLPVEFATIYLAPLIVEFSRLYPDIDFVFDMTPRLVDLVAEPIDVAIRMGEQPSSQLIARHLVDLPRHLYASPNYIAEFGLPREPKELTHHQCLVFQGAKTWTLHRAEEEIEVEVTGRFQLNSAGLIHRLCKADQGIGVLPPEVVEEDIAQGRLCRVVPGWSATPVPIYAVTETRLVPAKTRRFVEFLREGLQRYGGGD